MAKRKEVATDQPKAEYISDLHEELKRVWSKQRDDDEKALKVIEQEHEVDVPKPKGKKDFKPIIYRAGTAQDALDRYCGLLGKPIFQVEHGWGTKAETRSERGEDFFNLLPWDYEAREGPFYDDIRIDVLGIGRGFLEVAPKPEIWTKAHGYPIQGEGEDFDGKSIPSHETSQDYTERLKTWKKRISNPPISINYLPAASVLAVLSHGRVIEYVQEVKMLQKEATDRWPEALSAWGAEVSADAKLGTHEVTILKYGNKRYISVVAKRAMGKADQGDLKSISHFAHGMGVCPLALFEGFKSVRKEPGLRWRSIVKKALSGIVTLDNLRSRQATAIKLMPMAQYYFLQKGMPLPGEELPPIEIDPTEIKRFYTDEAPGVLEPARAPPEAEALDSKVQYDLEAFLPDLAKGMTGAAGTPAWSDRLKLDQVRNYLKPVVEGIALGARQTAQLVCKAIMSPHIGEMVYVRRPGKKGSEPIGIGPDDASDIHDRVTALIQTKIPSDRNADIGLAKIAYEFGMSWAWCVEDIIGVENPLEQKRRRMLEDVENSEPYRTRLLNDILAEADMLEATEAAVSPEELAGIIPTLPAAAQEAIAMTRQPPGPESMPPGAGPASLAKTGQPTGTIPGPSPFAPAPGAPV